MRILVTHSPPIYHSYSLILSLADSWSTLSLLTLMVVFFNETDLGKTVLLIFPLIYQQTLIVYRFSISWKSQVTELHHKKNRTKLHSETFFHVKHQKSGVLMLITKNCVLNWKSILFLLKSKQNYDENRTHLLLVR